MASNSTSNDIAVIGMACRFPGAVDLESFWEMLRSGREGITHFSEEELLAAGVSRDELEDPDYVRAYGWLEGTDLFAAEFFGYTPREASLMDPQQRLFLEYCWLALEHAGCDPNKVNLRTGVFAGAGQNAYRLSNLLTSPQVENAGDLESTLVNEVDFLTTRVSYKLGLTGPSLDVQTACSTSIVATHLAVLSLQSGECDLALAGGVSVVLPQKSGYRYVDGGTFSPDGHTRTFDSRAQGMVGGDGVGVLVLKRLEDALADGDTVFAVIRGTAVNNDGGERIGFTAPTVDGQARVIAEAQAVAGIEAGEIDFIELHGTATPLGDAVEFAALQKVFSGAGLPKNRVALGSVKSNIGHTNAAAGAAGLIKSILSLWHRAVPASLHFEYPNPEFGLAESPFFVNTALLELEPEAGRPLRAGVSSFGMGGTNAHAVLEEPPPAMRVGRRIFSAGTDFKRKRFWIEPGEKIGKKQGLKRSLDLSSWFYSPSWKRTPWPQRHSLNEGRWLIFSGDGHLSSGLLQALPGAVIVRAGAVFSGSEEGYTVRPGISEDYERLAEHLKSQARVPDRIIHLWNAENPAQEADDSLDRGFYSLLFLSQALSRIAPGAPIRLAVVTKTMQTVTGAETVDPLQAAVIGPVRVIPAELEGFECLSIDIDSDDETTLPARIISELSAATDRTGEACIAYRHGLRWKQTFRSYPLTPVRPETLPLREQGAYLITGGSGGVGQALARYLADNFRARLALVSRRGSDAALVRELEAAGADVLAVEADVSDSGQMHAAIEAIHRRFGKLHGVVHAAGLAGGGAIALKTREAAEAVLKAKVHGTLVLSDLLDNEPLDFVLLCSSLASTLGGYGQVDYTAANAFLDAFAAAASQEGRRTISLAWDTWREAGLAVDTPVPKELQSQREASLAFGLSNREGQEVFERAVAAGKPHLIVSTMDFIRRYAEKHLVAAAEPGTAEVMVEVAQEHTRNLTPVQAQVAAVWEQMFGISPIDLHADFFQLGGHSLLATQILNKLHRDLEGIEISMRALFERPTVAGIAALIEEQMVRAKKKGLSTSDLAALPAADRLEKLTARLEEALAGALVEDRVPDLIWLFKRDFDLRVYPQEIASRTGITDLASFLDLLLFPPTRAGSVELKTVEFDPPKPISPKNPPAVFILSAPRSGSTLLRLMLNAHSAFFAPPELALLAFDSMAAWQANQRGMFAVDGLTQALTAAGVPEAAEQVAKWVATQKPVHAVYADLQAAVAPAALVDKTPGYSMHVNILQRGEAWFDSPRYIHLVRHPVPVIDSFARNRMHIVLGQDHAAPELLAEQVWSGWNRNILVHLAEVGPGRHMRLRYENLVQDPDASMRTLCRFLEVPFEDAVLQPYRQDRMLAGPGDPDILLHDRINPALADAWKKTAPPVSLSPGTRELMREYGYPAPGADTGLNALSDEEVDRMLEQLLEEDPDQE